MFNLRGKELSLYSLGNPNPVGKFKLPNWVGQNCPRMVGSLNFPTGWGFLRPYRKGFITVQKSQNLPKTLGKFRSRGRKKIYDDFHVNTF